MFIFLYNIVEDLYFGGISMSGTKLLVMTYNIHSGKDINGRYSLDKIIKFINVFPQMY